MTSSKNKYDSVTYLFIYLVIIIVLAIIYYLVNYFYFDRPIIATTKKVENIGSDFDLLLKAACSVLITNVEASGSNLIKQLYRSDGQGVQNCQDILAN